MASNAASLSQKWDEVMPSVIHEIRNTPWPPGNLAGDNPLCIIQYPFVEDFPKNCQVGFLFFVAKINHFPKNHPKSSKNLRTSSKHIQTYPNISKHSSRKSSKIIQRKQIIPSISPTSTKIIPTKVTIHVVCRRFGGDEKALTGKPLMKRTMQIWINAADTLLAMIVTKLPSPRPGLEMAGGPGAGTAGTMEPHQDGPEVPRGELVRGPHGRCRSAGHPFLRPCRWAIFGNFLGRWKLTRFGPSFKV